MTPTTAECLCWQGPEPGALVFPLQWSSPGIHHGALDFGGRNLLPHSQVLQPSVWVLVHSPSQVSQCLSRVPQLLSSHCSWALCSVGRIDLHFRSDQLNRYIASYPNYELSQSSTPQLVLFTQFLWVRNLKYFTGWLWPGLQSRHWFGVMAHWYFKWPENLLPKWPTWEASKLCWLWEGSLGFLSCGLFPRAD